MEGMCCGVAETETAKPVEPSSQSARRRRMEIHQLKFPASDAAFAPPQERRRRKRHKLEKWDVPTGRPPTSSTLDESNLPGKNGPGNERDAESTKSSVSAPPSSSVPKFGVTSVCGRRKDMEDAVSIHPSFCGATNSESLRDLHFYGVFDGHGCSHVAVKCKDRMHEIVKDELGNIGEENESWEEMMKKSFSRMDEEVTQCTNAKGISSSSAASQCLCNLRIPKCDAVGSTAVVAVVSPDKIIVSNCGDSRAVLCRNGKAVPLSVDHKPDRPDELERIEKAGGRVIYWDGARVLGVLAMSRSIGDNYLKPYVVAEPEVTVIDRTPEDDCLILASDGLWDVLQNGTACGVARMCLRSSKPPPPSPAPGNQDHETVTGDDYAKESSDMACFQASHLLTKLALARQSTDNISVVVVDLRKT
ncbi:OLC1v1019359C1 [Oldenlandia corymbosa var. corymbosa]|uniref:protein-serine/threonine phosphatase n=1 Tax=Oldenlandia corymbosa var. corymbosa TaxID=529605 RepID=A0AAV1EE75_OLDCO|nr:OLC1v1019359C1 [Oldenlandia corymbosa var. corymbosa]